MVLRSIIVVVAGCQLLLASGQTTFKRRYDMFGQQLGQSATAIELTSDAAYVVFVNSAWQDSLYYSPVATTLVLEAQGDTIAMHRVEQLFHASSTGWANGSFPLQGGVGFGVGGSNLAQDDTQRPVLYFFDATGQPTSFIEYGVAGEEWIGRQGKQTPDGGFVICGETSSTASLSAFC